MVSILICTLRLSSQFFTSIQRVKTMFFYENKCRIHRWVIYLWCHGTLNSAEHLVESYSLHALNNWMRVVNQLVNFWVVYLEQP